MMMLEKLLAPKKINKICLKFEKKNIYWSYLLEHTHHQKWVSLFAQREYNHYMLCRCLYPNLYLFMATFSSGWGGGLEFVDMRQVRYYTKSWR